MRQRKRDYQRKKFKNPFFPQQKKTLKKRWLFVLLLILLAGLFFLNSSNYFKIRKIDISGNEFVSSAEIKDVISQQLRQKRFWFFSQDNIFFFNKNQAKKELNKKYSFTEVKINKKYFSTIQVLVAEKTSSLIWVSGDSQYYLDLQGVAVRKVSATDSIVLKEQEGTQLIRSEINSGRYPVIYDQSNNPVNISQRVVSKSTIDFVIELNTQLAKNADFSVARYSVSQPNSTELIMQTQAGWQVYFKTDQPVKKQVDLLSSVLQREVKDRSKLQYIDLRYDNKVFYK